MSMYISFFSTTLSRSSGGSRCGGLAPITPATSPLEVLIDHPLAQQDLVEPAAQRDELEEAFLGDQLDHEADLIHVPGEHHASASCRARLAADQAADFVLFQRAEPRQVLFHHGADFLLMPRNAVGFGQFL